MTWKYRIIRDENGGHRIAEVYGDLNDHPAWTADPMYSWGDDLDELRRDFEFMRRAFEKPVIDEAALRGTTQGETPET